jgi:hypothetical protein
MKLKMLAVSFQVALSIVSVLGVSSLVSACKSEEPAQQGGYPPQGQPAGYAQPPAQPGYGQPAPGAVPAAAPGAAPAAVPAAAPAAAPLSAPGPLALPCSSDANCATHHCNPQFGKCVFPCLNDNDCIAPNRCMAGACLPAAQ